MAAFQHKKSVRSLLKDARTDVYGRINKKPRRQNNDDRLIFDDNDDKENAFQPLCGSTPHGHKFPGRNPTSSAKKAPMTPIRELDQSHAPSCLPNFLTPKVTPARRRKHSSSPAAKVTKRRRSLEKFFFSPQRLDGGYVNLDVTEDAADSLLYPMEDSTQNTPDVTLGNVSQIHSQKSMIREQPSSLDLSGAFHSTFQYPLHSTFNYPLLGNLNFCNQLHIPRSPCSAAVSAPTNQDQPCVIDIRKYVLDKQTDWGQLSLAAGCACAPADDDDDDSLSDDSDVTEIDVDEYSCDSSCLSEDDFYTRRWDGDDDDENDDGISLASSTHSRIMKRNTGHSELSRVSAEAKLSPEGTDHAQSTSDKSRLITSKSSTPTGLFTKYYPSAMTLPPQTPLKDSQSSKFKRRNIKIKDNIGKERTLRLNATVNLSNKTKQTLKKRLKDFSKTFTTGSRVDRQKWLSTLGRL